MNIEGNNFHKDIAELEYGDCFIYSDAPHVKVDVCYVECPDIDEFPNVVLCLTTNKLNLLRNGTLVQVTQAKVVIG